MLSRPITHVIHWQKLMDTRSEVWLAESVLQIDAQIFNLQLHPQVREPLSNSISGELNYDEIQDIIKLK
jgi:hypothetical protein